MAQKRIYLVGMPDGKARLVKASLRQQALSYVANDLLTVQVATQDDLVTMLGAGVPVEMYSTDDGQEMIEFSESPGN